eukprot:scaffold1342_cov204-Pinguiococcus_pyrenoidosus.AAC.3
MKTLRFLVSTLRTAQARATSNMISFLTGVVDEFPGAVRVEVVRHVVALGLHVRAHLVEGRRGDQVALAVHLPRDGRVGGADLVVAGGSCGGSRVHGHVHAVLAVHDHAAHEVGVVEALVVHDHEDLGLHADGVVRGARVQLVEEGSHDLGLAEDTVVEGRLVLVERAALAGAGVGPVDLVGLADLHLDAVLPVVGLGEDGVGGVVGGALEALAGLAGEAAALVHVAGAGARLVELAEGVVLGAEVPVHVDGAEALLEVGVGDGHGVGLEVTVVALGDVCAGLLHGHDDVVLEALEVVEARDGVDALAGVVSRWRAARGQRVLHVDDVTVGVLLKRDGQVDGVDQQAEDADGEDGERNLEGGDRAHGDRRVARGAASARGSAGDCLLGRCDCRPALLRIGRALRVGLPEALVVVLLHGIVGRHAGRARGPRCSVGLGGRAVARGLRGEAIATLLVLHL